MTEVQKFAEQIVVDALRAQGHAVRNIGITRGPGNYSEEEVAAEVLKAIEEESKLTTEDRMMRDFDTIRPLIWIAFRLLRAAMQPSHPADVVSSLQSAAWGRLDIALLHIGNWTGRDRPPEMIERLREELRRCGISDPVNFVD